MVSVRKPYHTLGIYSQISVFPLFFRCKYEGVTAADTRSEYDFDAGSDVEAWKFVPYYR